MATPARTDALRPHEAAVLGPADGEAFWFLGARATIKVGGDRTRSRLTIMDFVNPPGFAPPVHRHLVEDECFYILSGHAVFTVDGEHHAAGPGDTVFLPVGSTHTFVVGADAPLHTLQITVPAGFEEFTAAVGEPAVATEPPGGPVDPAALVEAAARHHIEILGPPPSAAR